MRPQRPPTWLEIAQDAIRELERISEALEGIDYELTKLRELEEKRVLDR